MAAVDVDALDTSLGELLAVTGARAVRVVDGRTGRVVGVAGERAPSGTSDDSAAVADLLRDQLLRDQQRSVDGEALVTTDHSVHLLQPTPVTGVFVHLRLDRDHADTGRAHRALTDPRLHAAVRSALSPQARSAAVPRPRPVPVSAAAAARQPALAALAVGSAGSAGHGLRAAGVLTELLEVGYAAGTLPRRRRGTVRARPDTVVTAGLPERTWARDLDTMRRLLVGLRQLS